MAIYQVRTCFDCIRQASIVANSYGKSLDNKIYIFCEDKMTLSQEESLVKITGGTFNAEVLTFDRYMARKTSRPFTLSKEGSAMAVKKVLEKHGKELEVLRKYSSSPSLSITLSELIAQLKSAKVKPEELLSALPSYKGKNVAKIRDIGKVFALYEGFLSDKNFCDLSKNVDDMVKVIDGDDELKNSRVIISGYSSITKQSCEVIKKLYNTALSCDFIVVDGDNKDLYIGEFTNFVLSLTHEKPTVINFDLGELPSTILSGIFNPQNKLSANFSDAFLFEGKTVEEECEFIAKNVKREVLSGGKRYRDIAVAYGNIESASLILKDKFSKYDVPYFLDEKRNLLCHPVSKLIISLANAKLKNSLDDVITSIGSKLFIVDKHLSDGFIRFILSNAITYSTFYKNFDYDFGDYSAYRSFICDFLLSLKPNETVEYYANTIKTFLKKINVEDNIQKVKDELISCGANEEASYLVSALPDFQRVLDEMTSVSGQDQMTLRDFIKLLTAGLKASEVSLIPQRADSVYLSELKDCRFKRYKVLFVGGLNGDIPFVKSDTALLLDSDISSLDELSVKIEPKIRLVNRREKEAVGLALASFEEKLYLSYSITTANGKKTIKSDLIPDLCKIITYSGKNLRAFNGTSLIMKKHVAEVENDLDYLQGEYLSARQVLLYLLNLCDEYKNGLIDKADEISSIYYAIENYLGGLYLPTVKKILDYSDARIVKPLSNNTPLFFKGGLVSASKIENYYSCPYKFFLKYGVKIGDKIKTDISPVNVGTVFHELTEKFMLKIDEFNSYEECDEFCEKVMQDVFSRSEYKKFLQRNDQNYSYELMILEGKRLIRRLFDENKLSSFKVVGTEIEFGDGKKYPPIKLSVGDKKYKVNGKVDRLDAYKNYYRIIDYKTGKADDKSKTANFYTGQNVQLYLYLNAFLSENFSPVGAYYYGLGDTMKSADDKKNKMFGKTVWSKEIATATDKDFFKSETEGASSVIEGTYSVNKKNEEKTKNFISDETELKFMEYAKKISEKAISDVENGKFSPMPFENACLYCEFNGSCLFDKELSDFRKVSDVSESTIETAVGPEEKFTKTFIDKEKKNGDS